MTGKSHKAIGTFVGIALFLYGWRSGNYEFAPALITAPMGAMLPDIDHDHSKLGSARSRIVKISLAIVMLAFIGCLGYEYYAHRDLSVIIHTVSWVIVPILILIALSKIKAFHNALNFAVKHRGLMHTLVLPVLFFIGFIFLQDVILKYAVLALFIGYVSHIFADCLTPKGCPVLFPLTTKNIRILKIKTGSALEFVVTFMICILLIGAAFIVPRC